jgi:hypothetical protein
VPEDAGGNLLRVKLPSALAKHSNGGEGRSHDPLVHKGIVTLMKCIKMVEHESAHSGKGNVSLGGDGRVKGGVSPPKFKP